MRSLATSSLAVIPFFASCVPQPPEAPSPVREATVVAAGFAATWDATIDHFAENNIPIATIERVSGIIATTQLGVDREGAQTWSDCGTGTGFLDSTTRFWATQAVYNVLVRGDEQSSTLRVTVSWSNPSASFECVSTGVWEEDTERAIKERAEGSSG